VAIFKDQKKTLVDAYYCADAITRCVNRAFPGKCCGALYIYIILGRKLCLY